MTTNDDLENFFKKKDRKAKKPTKQTGLLTNNEEMLKQLVIVTSATSAFKENLDFDDEEDEENNVAHNNHSHGHVRHRPNSTQVPVDEVPGGGVDENSTVLSKPQPYTVKANVNNDKTSSSKLPVQDNTNTTGQQDEWEEFEDRNSKLAQLRMKFSRGDPSQWDEDDDDDEDEEGNHPDHTNAVTGEDATDMGNDDQPTRANRRRDQQKEKPAWKLDQLNQQNQSPPAASDSAAQPTNKVEEPPAAPKPAPASTGAYRPPQMRSGGTSVTIVSGGEKPANVRGSKKKEPNLASTEEFPTLGAAINKK